MGSIEKKIADRVIRFGAIVYKSFVLGACAYSREKLCKPLPKRLHSIVQVRILARFVGPVLYVLNALGLDKFTEAKHF